ncbi:ABC transporter ATP-binding protein [Desulforamulus ruminis]|uniref:Oligopeptide/dipeptide ABC transporter, ATPase subunit n=1 Tax=Desulforamulus ruminis (strain ATCC 23193 / DSM 2154 / NCIMB 8452 / DL) TaxID=696281 RepID=F6DKW4_DESRL|nr:ABC transporter ATP-binding protein [Desulforamulus ruminis]AEG61596.1 oligopeptide/dipeptide ABC transporter, ATPase subunit [Desulforamulus ruminis DSM 2154]
MEYILELKNLKKHFSVEENLLGPKKKSIMAVNGVDLKVAKGETLGLVGESGCGKSTLANLIIRLEEPTEGSILLAGTDITRMSEKQLKPLRSRMQMIFQDPYSSLDPRMKVGQIVAEPMAVLGRWTKAEMRERVVSLLAKVGLGEQHLDRHPHEFSGGQRQRISLARALTTDPELLILDEPTSALDVSVQAQVLNLLLELQSELKLTYLFISHNLSVINYLCHRVAVMYLGKIVEEGPTKEVLHNPLHPYTRALLEAVPKIGGPDLWDSPSCGEPPNPDHSLAGCRYHPRCCQAKEHCAEITPSLVEWNRNHFVACMEANR